MNPRVKTVKPLPGYRLKLGFTNGEIRLFDVTPYLDTGIFRELRELRVFNSVRPFLGSIQWKNGQDLCPDTLYEQGEPVAKPSSRALKVAEQPARYGKTRRRKKLVRRSLGKGGRRKLSTEN